MSEFERFHQKIELVDEAVKREKLIEIEDERRRKIESIALEAHLKKKLSENAAQVIFEAQVKELLRRINSQYLDKRGRVMGSIHYQPREVVHSSGSWSGGGLGSYSHTEPAVVSQYCRLDVGKNPGFFIDVGVDAGEISTKVYVEGYFFPKNKRQKKHEYAAYYDFLGERFVGSYRLISDLSLKVDGHPTITFSQAAQFVETVACEAAYKAIYFWKSGKHPEIRNFAVFHWDEFPLDVLFPKAEPHQTSFGEIFDAFFKPK